MNTTRRQPVVARRTIAGLGAALLLAGLPTTAAVADDAPAPDAATDEHCLSLTLYFWLLGGSTQYVLGPDHCALGTPWSQQTEVGREASDGESGVGFRISVPVPEH